MLPIAAKILFVVQSRQFVPRRESRSMPVVPGRSEKECRLPVRMARAIGPQNELACSIDRLCGYEIGMKLSTSERGVFGTDHRIGFMIGFARCVPIPLGNRGTSRNRRHERFPQRESPGDECGILTK